MKQHRRKGQWQDVAMSTSKGQWYNVAVSARSHTASKLLAESLRRLAISGKTWGAKGPDPTRRTLSARPTQGHKGHYICMQPLRRQDTTYAWCPTPSGQMNGATRRQDTTCAWSSIPPGHYICMEPRLRKRPPSPEGQYFCMGLPRRDTSKSGTCKEGRNT